MASLSYAFHLDYFNKRNNAVGEVPTPLSVVEEIKDDHEDSCSIDWSDISKIQKLHREWCFKYKMVNSERVRNSCARRNANIGNEKRAANGNKDFRSKANDIMKERLAALGITKFGPKYGHSMNRQALWGKVEKKLNKNHVKGRSFKDVLSRAQPSIDRIFAKLAKQIETSAPKALEIKF
ncbi:hypothetical protein JCM3765_005427 [Sporobolomyces pararoseus]